MFRLHFAECDIADWAGRYADTKYLAFQNRIGPSAHERGFLTRAGFLAMCDWKSPRSRSRCEENSPAFIREVTRASFAARDARLRIEVLTLLKGVSWPTASVILHFCVRDRYPIIDFRALWSLGYRKTPIPYDFKLWHDYTQTCRAIAKRNHVSMRTLDMALWQYSKERQRSTR